MGDDPQRAKRAFERLRSMTQGGGVNDTARIGARCSQWANPVGAQWKDVNARIDRGMVHSIWPGVPDDNIKKGRLKLTQCSNADIRENAENIYLDVTGHPMHHMDCPLWFAKMLYMHFVLGEQVDFSSREPHLTVSDIRSNAITVTRQELALALDGASMEVHEVKEELQTQLRQATQGPPGESSSSRDLQREVKVLSRHVKELEAALKNHNAATLIEHPSAIEVAPTTGEHGGPCPICKCFFHEWCGHFCISCGHMYHISCLMQSMMNSVKCALCPHEISSKMYAMFKMTPDYIRLTGQRDQENEDILTNISLSLG